MARARNIKPGFFKNEDLGTADPFVSLLFAGLWTLADKSGILEDRPLRIKAELFPYRENFDINGYLTVLVSLGLIHRYTASGLKLIQVANFKKHQTPHHTEKASEYPEYSACCENSEGQPLINGATPSDSLIPDSLIPDSLMGESADESAKEKKQVRKATQIPTDFYPNETGVAYAENKKLSLAVELESFRNFHTAKGSTWKDWQATWRTWCDRAVEYGRGGAQPRQRGSPGYQSIHDKRAETIAILTGKKSHERTNANERDITGESRRVAV